MLSPLHSLQSHLKSFITKTTINTAPIGSSLYNSCKSQFTTLQKNAHISPKLKSSDYLEARHIGPTPNDTLQMLQTLSVSSMEELITQTIPPKIYDKDALNFNGHTVGPAISEHLMLQHMQKLANENQQLQNYIGMGYYGTLTPPPIQRNILENPGWYTAYTPYQPEVAQGRLQLLLIYQTMICSLTGLEVSNASLLDEASAAADTIFLSISHHSNDRNKFFVSDKIFPTTLATLKTRAAALGVEIVVGDPEKFNFQDPSNANNIAGVLVQSPDNTGQVHDYTNLFSTLKKHGIVKILATDLLANVLSKSAGEMGADISFGSAQRFGIPMGYGGPAAAFMAASGDFKRKLPGRIIGVSKDSKGNRALRMALQTREQHIKREKATSNICTAQALLANMSAAYAVYHGPKGIKQIAERCNSLAQLLSHASDTLGYQTLYTAEDIFDTVALHVDNANALRSFFESNNINIRVIDDHTVSFSVDETTSVDDIKILIRLLAKYQEKSLDVENYILTNQNNLKGIVPSKRRTSGFLEHQIFNTHHSESQLMRFLYNLQKKDITLQDSMIALGSCTMKLNAASQLMPVSFSGFGQLHPFTPINQVGGYTKLVSQLQDWLKIITQFDGISLQPNSGAQGEYAGLMAIRGYHLSRGPEKQICLIPTSAHGTNPASAAVSGMIPKTVQVENGLIDLKDLRQQAEKYKSDLGAFMITYPSTCGIYEETVNEAIDIIHHYGGQVYMDGANMNAQVGFTSPGYLGADVCHLNLHKTFAIPHGGGGPGMGPIGVKKHLIPFLPGHPIIDVKGNKNVTINSAQYGSASILPISYSYIGQLGTEGLRRSTAVAILNANYLMNRLKDHYQIVFTGDKGRVAHEFIIDIRPFKDLEVKQMDISKRLMDFGFHAPTVSFPIAGTLMIEPTESEDKAELDRFADALIKIRQQIDLIGKGVYSQTDNPLKNAPHTITDIISDKWSHPYSKDEAVYPLPYVQQRGKFWPSVNRIDDSFGDRNFCGCL